MERITLHIDQLVINPDINPRHATDDDVSDLVAQISANGFADALWVRPVSKSFEKRARLLNPSTPKGEQLFEVIDGSRRLRAVRQILEGGGTPPGWHDGISCDLFEVDDSRARELALAAHVARKPLSPADEARAFYSLRLGGMKDEDIASHYAVPVSRVRQRVAIGQLPDPIIDALRAGKISIDAARAFTLTNSHELQLKIFEREKGNLSKWAITEALTKKTVPASDSRAVFVGLDAYREAGGQVIEDLFSDSAYLNNEKLLQKLFDEKLKATVKATKDEGWAFVKVLTENTRHQKYDHKEVPPKGKRELTAEDHEAIEQIEKRLAEIAPRIDELDEVPHDYHPTETEREEYDRLTAEREQLDDRLSQYQVKPYTKKQIESLGVIIVVPHATRHEKVEILRGRMPVEKEKQAATRSKMRKDPEATKDEPETPAAALREAGFTEAVEVALVKAARDALKLAMIKDRPAIAARLGLAARVQHWLGDTIGDFLDDEPPFIGVSQHYNTPISGGDRYNAHLAELGFSELAKCSDFAGILAALETFPPERITALEAVMAAHWLSFSVLRNVDVQAVIAAIDPDMRAEGFTIDADFLGKLSCDQLALISVEINPDEPVAKGKKPEMVAAVLPLIEKSGWLPPQLRTPSYRGPGSEHWPPKEETAGEAQAQDQAA